MFCSDAGKLDLMFVYDDVYVFVFCFSKVELYFFRKSDVMLLIVQASIVAHYSHSLFRSGKRVGSDYPLWRTDTMWCDFDCGLWGSRKRLFSKKI